MNIQLEQFREMQSSQQGLINCLLKRLAWGWDDVSRRFYTDLARAYALLADCGLVLPKQLDPTTHYRDAQGNICEVDRLPPLDPELLIRARVFGQQLRGLAHRRLREVLDAVCEEANKPKET